MYISRDPFAREETHKILALRRAEQLHRTCDWCGNRDMRGKLWKIETRPDDSGRRNTWRGIFCSISCARIHNS